MPFAALEETWRYVSSKESGSRPTFLPLLLAGVCLRQAEPKKRAGRDGPKVWLICDEPYREMLCRSEELSQGVEVVLNVADYETCKEMHMLTIVPHFRLSVRYTR